MMKLLGATMVVLACTGAGFIAAAYANIEAVTLKQYILALDYMICDLEYSHAPLPELFTKASDRCNSILKKVFYQLAVNLESQIYPSVRECFENTIGSFTYIPRMTLAGLYQLGDTVGALDLHGQISSMQADL